jgi:hypothetical protein
VQLWPPDTLARIRVIRETIDGKYANLDQAARLLLEQGYAVAPHRVKALLLVRASEGGSEDDAIPEALRPFLSVGALHRAIEEITPETLAALAENVFTSWPRGEGPAAGTEDWRLRADQATHAVERVLPQAHCLLRTQDGLCALLWAVLLTHYAPEIIQRIRAAWLEWYESAFRADPRGGLLPLDQPG